MLMLVIFSVIIYVIKMQIKHVITATTGATYVDAHCRASWCVITASK